MTSNRIAHCCCGSLKAQTTGEPELVAACSCGQCQRRTGSVIGVSSYWRRDKVVTSGGAIRYLRKGHSGGDVAFYFCPACGSTVYWDLVDKRPEWIGIAAGMFSDPNFPSPSMSAWEKNKAQLAFHSGWAALRDPTLKRGGVISQSGRQAIATLHSTDGVTSGFA